MKIICIGDSLTYGYGVGYGVCWVDLLKELSGTPCLNFGVNGDTSGYMLDRATRKIIPEYVEPDNIVVIMGGANDVLTYGANDNDVNNIIRIAKASKTKGAIPIVGIQPGFFKSLYPFYGPLSLEKLNENFNSFADSLILECKKREIAFIDLRDIFQNHSNLFSDGVHPTNVGHKLIADELLKTILKFVDTISAK